MVACPSRAAVLALVFGLALAVPAHATGVICGTVRDGITANPIVGAGIFVRQTTGQYTGYNGATDATGHYCVGGIPAGTYDLEVRLDDYQVAYRRGIVVNDAVTGVDVDARYLQSTLSPPWPNPGRNSVSFRLRIRDAGPIRLTVVDANGRALKGWKGLAGAGDRTLNWDFRDATGHELPAGRYFARLSAGDLTIVRSFVRLP